MSYRASTGRRRAMAGLVAGLATMALIGGCSGNDDDDSTSPTTGGAVSRSAASGGRCMATTMLPATLPDGSSEVDGRALAVEKSLPFVQGTELDWVRGWTRGASWLVVAGGPTGDFGDDPTVRGTTVRGHRAQMSGAAEETRILTWMEPSDCEPVGSEQYVAMWSGYSDDEAVRTVQSLYPVLLPGVPPH